MASFFSYLRSTLTPVAVTLAIALTALASSAYVVLGAPVEEALTRLPRLRLVELRDSGETVSCVGAPCQASACQDHRDGLAAVPVMQATGPALFHLQPREGNIETPAQLEFAPMANRRCPAQQRLQQPPALQLVASWAGSAQAAVRN